MERIFQNLYRITYELPPGAKVNCYHYSYLLLRKKGNIFIGHSQGGSTVTNYFDEIEHLGGIDSQVITHYFDARKGVNEALYERFGCKLHYHQEARKILRAKTKCPGVEFGDEGLKMGSDFRALYFPGSRPGRTILWWKSGGKAFLFMGHSIRWDGDEWAIDFNPHRKPHL
jgi:hypothetical protein